MSQPSPRPLSSLVIAALMAASCSGRIAGELDDSGHAGAYGSSRAGSSARGGAGGTSVAGAGGATSAGPCRVAMPLRRLSTTQYRNTIRDLFVGQVEPGKEFPAVELGGSKTGFSTEPNANLVTTLGAELVMEAAEQVALAVVDKLPALLPCAAKSPGDACAGTFIDQYARRAYRRPITAADRSLLMNAYKMASGTDAFDPSRAWTAVSIARRRPARASSPDIAVPMESAPIH